jgi:hypothetical protein
MCCGKKRAEEAQTTETHPAPKPEETISVHAQPESDPLIYFQYLGTKGLTVTAPTSGKRYRFDSPGAIVIVDPRDRGALAGVSVLRQVRKVAETQ